ncbi:MAG: hypothetical protein CSA33_01255 [Desulfobulbus propionicus]|nr:MAG: hypothetical protein CSA33_01255 [Desulfobulbus propionicus]
MGAWEAKELIGGSQHDLVHHRYTGGTLCLIEACLIPQVYLKDTVHFGSNEYFWARDETGFPVEKSGRKLHTGKKQKAVNKEGREHAYRQPPPDIQYPGC